MAQDDVVEELKQALLARAEQLAKEYLARAQRARDHILEDAHERLRIREQNEVLAAQAAAERHYRRTIQANELRLKAQLDKLRWSLVQAVMDELPKHLQAFTQERTRYLTFLARLTAHACKAIEREALILEVNAFDQQWLQEQWADFLQAVASSKSLSLHPVPYPCSGGILIRDPDNRIRIDNTFEGRIERLTPLLWQSITERLFAAEISQRGLLND